MIIATPLAEAKPQALFWYDSTTLRSPDGRWMIVVHGEKHAMPRVKLDQSLPKHTVAVAETATGHVIGRFDFERSADAYWMKDGRTLIVNYYEGSDISRPLVFILESGTRHPMDLRQLVAPDLTTRSHVAYRALDHYYAFYSGDLGNSVQVDAQFRYNVGPVQPDGSQHQDWKCYSYKIDKATFSHVTFIGENKSC